MKDFESEMKRLSETIEEAKSSLSEMKGSLKSEMERAKKQFDCDTVEELEKKLKSVVAKKLEATKKRDEAIEMLKKEYEW